MDDPGGEIPEQVGLGPERAERLYRERVELRGPPTRRFQTVKGHPGGLAGPHVLARRLPQGGGVSAHVENVVDDLESETDRLGEGKEREKFLRPHQDLYTVFNPYSGNGRETQKTPEKK